MIAVSPYSFCHGWSYPIVSLQTEAAKTVSPLISAVLLQTSGRDTWSTGHFIMTRIQESTTANAFLIINGVLYLQEGLWSLIRFISETFQVHVFQPAS